jgi:hypothetical protein
MVFLLDKLIADAIVGELAHQRARQRADCQPKEGYKEDQPKEHALKGAAERAGCSHAEHLTGLGLFLANRPGDNRRIQDREELLLLHLFQATQRLGGAVRRAKFKHSECRYREPPKEIKIEKNL